MPRWLPVALFALGGVMVAASVAGFLFGGDTSESVSAPASTVATTSTSAATTTMPSSTTSSSSSSTTQAATTTVAETTTTTVPAETVEEFISAFSEALATGDESFVQDRLHPQVIDGYGEDLCRAWVTREIMALSEYELVSVDGGPQTRSYAFANGSQTVPDVFDATVSFTFSGQAFTDTTNVALVQDKMHWLGQCR